MPLSARLFQQLSEQPSVQPERTTAAATELTPGFHLAEGYVDALVQWLRLVVETVGALVIAVGVLVGLLHFVRGALHHTPDRYNAVRLRVARYLAVGLEFQLAADILSTAIAPTWTQIGKLGAIAVIRTFLNYFLERDIREVRAAREEGRQAAV